MKRFIVFEGLDGTGKTTQISLLRDELQKNGETVFVTAEPTKTETGRLLRRVLSGELSFCASAQAALFLCDRIEHCREIKAHLEAGETVLCDRYYYSTFAYQGSLTDMNWLYQTHKNCPDILTPDLTLFLTMSPALCMKRILDNRGSEATEIFETEEKLTAVKARFEEVFHTLNSRENIRMIDASGSIQSVFEQIRVIVSKM